MQVIQSIDRNGFPGGDPRLLPIYSVHDVAHHLGLAPTTVRSWALGVLIPADRAGSLLSFQNLTEVHVLSALRGRNIPLRAIRKAVDYLRAELGTDHPLADAELHTDRTEILCVCFGTLVSATSEGQVAMRPVLEPYLERVERDPSGLLRRLFPIVAETPEERLVTIDPFRKFGRPYLVDVGVETSAIAGRFRAGETVADLAADFEATEAQIEGALRFERLFKSAA